MRLDETDLKYLWDMLDAARRALSHVAGMTEEQYRRDRKTQDAVERTVEIVGEAARHVSEPARAQFPELRWGSIVAARHILAHEYDDVNQQVMWKIITIHLPVLTTTLAPVVEANPPGPEAGENPTSP
ncbi:MAG: HepT-like ribonuclease domain-containing protein [Phycisphaerales bacterium]